MRRLNYRLFNIFYDVTNIIIRYHRTCWQADTYLEDSLTNTIHVCRSILINRLLMHRMVYAVIKSANYDSSINSIFMPSTKSSAGIFGMKTELRGVPSASL